MSAYISGASVAIAVLAFAVGWAWDFFIAKANTSLHDHLGRAAGAAGVPSAVFLVYAAFDPGILATTPNLNVPIAFGGLSLFYVSVKAAFRPAPSRRTEEPKEASVVKQGA